MNKNNDIIITLESEYKKLQLTINKHSSLSDWVQAFKVLLLHQTFDEDTIKELFAAWENPDSACEGCYYLKNYENNHKDKCADITDIFADNTL